uniref:G-protein coupled receptors family 1 profile domain-containing protein n=1 Tax=Acrobeloides nanus TaxID=290746 RepID=A0A914CVG6_9BILA
MAQFLLPFATMSICYGVIFMKLNERNKTKLKKLNERAHLLETSRMALSPIPPDTDSSPETPPNFASFEEKQRALLNAQQRRTTTILASMVLIFGLTWLPQNIVTLIIEYDDTILQRDTVNYTYIISMIAHSIAMTTNIANPILYAWLNASFKELFIRTFTQIKANKQKVVVENASRISVNGVSNGYCKNASIVKLNSVREPSDSV